MKKRSLLLLGALAVFPALSAAAVFDFTTLGSNNTALGTTETVNGIEAAGFVYASPTSYTANILWLRDQTNDHGLGVCSEGNSNCSTGGGNINELSNQANAEVIRLEKSANETWTELWVSSLDGTESGRLYWSTSGSENLSTSTDFFSFTSPAFGGSAVEGDLLTLAAASSFDDTANFVYFVAGTSPGSTGGDNDYLVWKGTTSPVPLPAAVWLFGSSLIGLTGFASRRKA